MINKVLVIGDLMIDHYLWGNSDRISPEAPVPVVNIKSESKVLGGAGNVVNNLKAFELDVTVMSVIGDDEIANELIEMLEVIDVNRYLILDESRKTTKKTRVIAAHQQVIRYDNELKEPINNELEQSLVYKLMETIHTYDIVILSDYGKGVLTDTFISKIMFITNGANIKVLVDPKGANYERYRGAYLLTPNKQEAQEATNIIINSDDTLQQALKQIQSDTSVHIPMITLGEDGIVVFENNQLLKKPTVAKEVFDVTGAGDTVISALAYATLQEYSITDMIEFANLAAGVVVSKLGSATATLDEIEEYKNALTHNKIDNKIKKLEDLKKVLKKLHSSNKKIVFTNGCFDILHAGHIRYLEKAKEYGDILIIGLNSDKSIQRLKGDLRPINNQEDRALLLSALQFVDYVVLFEEDTPYNLIKQVSPDILIKGADYKWKEVVGSDLVKELILIDFISGKSTTNIINKIKNKDKR
jgi:D-beta-D-heptose 7-phosphate kinase/D-beta-D-heptose 1-phosphate adenosyltransferase